MLGLGRQNMGRGRTEQRMHTMNPNVANMLQDVGLKDLYAKVRQLDEASVLVEEGKLKREVYENLVADFKQSLAKEQEKKKNHKGFFSDLLQSLGLNSEHSESERNPYDGEKPIQAGYLYEYREKAGRFRSHWKKRWCALYKREFVIFKNKNDHKGARTIVLTCEYFVQKASGGGKDSAADRNPQGSSNALLDEDDETLSLSTNDLTVPGRGDHNLENAFYLSDLDSKYTFAAKTQEEMDFWVHTLTVTLRKIIDEDDYFDTPVFIDGPVRDPNQIQKDFEARKKAYLQSKRKKTLEKNKRKSFFSKGKKMTDEEWAIEEAKWEQEIDEIAKIEMARKFWEREREHVRRLEEAQKEKEEELARVKQLAVEWEGTARENQVKREEAEKRAQDAMEHEKVLEEELARLRMMRTAQNIEKEEALRAEHELTQEQLKDAQKKRRQSQHPAALAEYEKEIKALQAKLAALQSALDVNLDGLDWDGTLEDAEEKMKQVVPRLMSDNPAEAMAAQDEFDQWDKIIRNHADYKKREEQKWIDWENENRPKNEAALQEMKKLVPKEVLTGLSEDFLKKKGLRPAAAKRVMATKIFQFLYMDKEDIAKVHIADLSSRYIPQGLDIVELRAIYLCLPDEFHNDRDGRKKVWLETYRSKLFALTNKEKNGELTRTEQRHPAYRDPNENKAANKANANANKKKKKGKKPAVAKKLDTSKLEGLFAGPRTGPPAAAGGPGKGGPAGGGFPGAGGPPPHILAMMQRGAQQSEEEEEKKVSSPVNAKSAPAPPAAAAAAAAAAANSSVAATPPSADGKRKSKSLSKRLSNKVTESGGGFMTSFRNLITGGGGSKENAQPPPAPDAIANAAAAATKAKNDLAGDDDKNSNKKKKKKKGGKREMTEKEKLLADSVRAQMDSAKAKNAIQVDDFDERNAPAFDFGTDYGNNKSRKQTLSRQRAGEFNKGIEAGINQLLQVIENKGKPDSVEGGIATMTFGELFEEYERISDMLVGLLMRAKKRKLVKYHGDMLFQGIHDSVKITLLVPSSG